MAKKKKSNKNNQLYNFVSIILLVISLVLWFTSGALGKAGSSSDQLEYLKLAFGQSEKVLGVTVVIFSFSFLNLLPVILMVLGLLIILIMTFKPKTIPAGQAKILVSILLFVSAVLLLAVKSFVITGTLINIDDYKLTAFGIITPILTLVSAGVLYLK